VNRFLSTLLIALTLLASTNTSFAADASIEHTFDRNKGAIYALYSRALRENPTIKGKIVFNLDIAASGEVTDCRVNYSELDAPDLEAQLRARIKLFRFAPRSAPITVSKQVDFFPAA